MASKEKDERFLNAFMTVWTIHKTGEPSEMIISAYMKALETFKIEQIEQAFGYSLTGLQWFPKPVELINYINRSVEPKEVTAQEHAGYLKNSIIGKGFLNPGGWQDEPTTARLLRGRFNINRLLETSLESDLKWIVKDFIAAYLETADFVEDTLQIENTKTGYKTIEDVKRLAEGIG